MNIEEDEEFKKNLINLLKLFKDRPYHLAKYLITNSAFNNSFYNKILKSDKLNSLKDQPTTYFYDIHTTDANGHTETVLHGIAAIYPEVTR